MKVDDAREQLARVNDALSSLKSTGNVLEGTSTLLPYFAFASFMQSVGRGEVERHYEAVMDLAHAARPTTTRGK